MPVKFSSQEKQQLIMKTYRVFSQHGISKTSTEELARNLGISKATLYKYWKGKKVLVNQILEEIQQHMHFDAARNLNTIDDVLKNLQELLNLAIIQGTSISTGFFAETKSLYPDIYQQHIEFLDDLTENGIKFCAAAENSGFFRATNFRLVFTLLQSTLPIIIDTKYIVQYELTLTTVLKDFYELLLRELLSNEYLFLINSDETYKFIDKLVKKLNL